MYLKSIEVHGFKSFANKLLFEFHEGITGIVGPNGSGKSNVADAVRWVLGEQSAKQLRSGNMQDVIFAGTENRKPLSFASVAITFDNSDHQLDVDYEEVTVTRRLYRSGESEYLLNNSICRLKDINEIFYDTGIGKEGYSIIGQGQIDKILSGRPEERRELFDEAAGIVKFKRRKTASLKKLDEEQQNLVRITDILNELTRELEPLRKQSVAAKIYLDKREELKSADIALFDTEVDRTDKLLSEISRKQEILDNDTLKTGQALDRTKAEYEKLEADTARLDSEMNTLRTDAQNYALESQQHTGKIQLLEEQIRALSASDSLSRTRKEQISSDVERKNADYAQEIKEQERLIGNLDGIEIKEKAGSEKLADADRKIEELEASVSRAKQEVIDVLNTRANVKGKIQRYDTMLEQIRIRKAEIGSRLKKIREDEAAASTEQKRFEDSISRGKVELDSIINDLNEKQARSDLLKGEISSFSIKLEELERRYHRDESRLESLKAMAERYEGYSGGIRKIMDQRRTNPGIKGVVADIISVPKQYEIAVETALGGSIRNIVTDNESTAKYLIEYLKLNKLGRATFLPLTSIRKRKFDNSQALREKGVIGIASDLVECDPEYEELNGYLLGRTLVIDTIDNAILLGRKYRHSIYMVTLTGESFSPGGSITGGAYKNTENLLGRKREIEELEVSVKEAGTGQIKLKNAIDTRRTERSGLRDIIGELQEEARKTELKLNTAEISKKQYDEQLRLSGISCTALERESNELDLQIEEVTEKSSGISGTLKESENTEAEISARTSSMEEELSGLRVKREQLAKDLEAIHLDAASARENLEFRQTNVKRLKYELASLEQETKYLEQQMTQASASAADKQKEIEKKRENVALCDKRKAECESKIREKEEEKAALSREHKDFFERRDSLTSRLSQLDKEAYRLLSQKERLEESLDTLTSYLWEEYELTPSEARKKALTLDFSMDRPALRKEISRLKSEIKQLGNVNVNSIEQYKEVLERHTFLTNQHNDLVESEKQLLGIIDELDRGMRKQFNETFALVNLQFDKVFKELFGGGRGTIEMDPDADVLEANISIIAHPPGKKLQNMMQLSGGEKALTAIALLFAIQNLRPSPFCLLDEIEAALDDSNVSRFANYLHKLTNNTQFIIITHRRGTMNAADRLYGITMQEKGVSTLISVNLIEDELSK